MEAIKGFYSYITDKKIEKFNSSDYYVKVNLSSTNDSTDYFEISLYSYAITNFLFPATSLLAVSCNFITQLGEDVA